MSSRFQLVLVESKFVSFNNSLDITRVCTVYSGTVLDHMYIHTIHIVKKLYFLM